MIRPQVEPGSGQVGVLPLISGLWAQDAGSLLPYEMMAGKARGRPAPGGQAKREGTQRASGTRGS